MKTLPTVVVPERFDDQSKEWAYRIGTLPYDTGVDGVAMVIAAAREQALAPVRRQMLAILVRDFGYTAEPAYGHAPLRHQFAWRDAVEGMSQEAISATVAEMQADESRERLK